MFDKGRDGAQYIHILVDSAVRLEYAMMSKTSITIFFVIKAMRREILKYTLPKVAHIIL